MPIRKDAKQGGQAYPYFRSDATGMTLLDRIALELLGKVIREAHAPAYRKLLIKWAYDFAQEVVEYRRELGIGE